MKYPQALEDLINSFESLPSIGRKSAERLALYVYNNMSLEQTENFSKNLIQTKEKIKQCQICHNLSENDICDICSNDERDKSKILVVETIKDLIVIESVGEYDGLYHVLDGSINFAKGIGIEDINIASLLRRAEDENVKEIILATNATLEGETTARYIKTMLEDIDVNITRIAHGLPVGGDISYADEMTVLKSLEGRQKY